ncbi:MAG: aspartate carbamoyltransferase [Clostridia bacterium]|nr:aspartate carbamoyltransferase [Clostridia bacterium]
MYGSHFIDFNQLTQAQWDELYALACDMMTHRREYADVLRGRTMATLFYEPSTRTQFSFQAAMLRMGGSVMGFSDPNNSSVSKGETLRDTIKIMSNYADVIVMRNYLEGAALAASMYARVPLINAGDGGHLHPTQTLTDLISIRKFCGRTENLILVICGDLMNGRTVHSLLRAMIRFPGNRFRLVCTQALRLPLYVEEQLRAANAQFEYIPTLEEALPGADVLYMTRIQKERFASREEYEKQAGIFVLDRKKMELASKDLVILHPLPKVDEIEPILDDDPRALYFRQAENGMYGRMALILNLLKEPCPAPSIQPPPLAKRRCHNPRCVSQFEAYLPDLIGKTAEGREYCLYCDKHI